MKRIIISCLLFSTLSLFSQTVFAQAWTRDQGHFYSNVSYSRLSGTAHYGFDGTKHPFPEPSQYIQNTVGLYLEYGVVDRWLTTIISTEWLRDNTLPEQGSTRGLGDTRIGFWSGIVTKPFRLSVGLTTGIPTGDAKPQDLGAGATDNSKTVAATLPTGDGEFDFEPSLIFGHSFGGGRSAWPLAHFLVAQAGYQIRTQEKFKPAISYKIELGTKLPDSALERFWLITRFVGVEGLSLGDASSGSIGGVGNATHATLGLELFASIADGFGVSAGVDLAVRARGIVSAIPVKAALSYEY